MSVNTLTKVNPGKGRLILKNESEILEIDFNELIYAMHRDNCFLFFLKNELILMKGIFKELLHQLPEQFIVINRQTIVNLDYLKNINPKERKEIIKNSSKYKISVKQLAMLCKIFGIRTK